MMYKTLKVEALKKLVFQVLLSAGETEENAGIIFENLLEDEYMNKPTHGFYRIPSIVEALKTRNAVLPVKISQSNSIFSVDGQRNIGLVAVRKACDSIIAASKEQPLVMAGIFNYISTTGAIGYYTRYLARNGLISIMTCISGATVVPHGGMDPLLAPIQFPSEFRIKIIRLSPMSQQPQSATVNLHFLQKPVPPFHRIPFSIKKAIRPPIPKMLQSVEALSSLYPVIKAIRWDLSLKF